MKNDQLLLTLGGIITWAIIAYVEIGQLHNSLYVLLSVLGYTIFIMAFLPIASSYSSKFPPPVRYLLVSTQLIASVLLLFINHGTLVPILLSIWTAQLPDFYSRTQSFIQVIVIGILFYLIMRFHWNEASPFVTCIVYWGIQLFGLSSSFARVREGYARRGMEKLNQQLFATRILLEQTSRQDERVRIARDLHDILGHQLTALNLQLEILHHKVSDSLRPNVLQSKELAKSLLENIRCVVRDQRNHLSLDIREAIYAFCIHLPQIDMQIEGELQLDSVQLAEQLVLSIQEGISNALRHGKAEKIILSLHQEGRDIRIYLDDNGKGLNPNYIQKKGTGLIGMGERLRAYNSRIELLPLSGGTRLSISLEAHHD